MRMIRFEWDKNKAKLNKNKHKISFDEAKTVFYDKYAKLIDDPDHSEEEQRFIILGLSNNLNILIVCHCYRTKSDGNEVIRIISARKADSDERIRYGSKK